jgi:hypothetical protein
MAVWHGQCMSDELPDGLFLAGIISNGVPSETYRARSLSLLEVVPKYGRATVFVGIFARKGAASAVNWRLTATMETTASIIRATER